MRRLLSASLAVLAALATALSIAAAPADAAKPKPGFVVSGGPGKIIGGKLATGAVVVDRRGREHVVALTSASGHHRVTYRYEVRGAGGKLKSSQRRTIAVAGPAEVSAFLSTNGRKLVVVVAGCKGIHTSRTPIGSGRLHTPALAATNVKHCTDDSVRPRLFGAVPTPGGGIAVLASTGLASANAPADPPFGVLTGTPGKKLRPAAHQPPFPAEGGADAYRLARDPDTGRLVVVDTQPSGVPYTVDVADSVQGTGGTWSPFTVVGGPISDAYQNDLDATAAGGQVTAVLSSHMVDTRSVPGPLLVFQGPETGQRWGAPTAVPATTAADRSPRVVTRPDGALVLSFVTCSPGDRLDTPGRIRAMVRTGGVWGTPTYLSKSLPVRLDTLTTNKHGTPVVGFARRPSNEGVGDAACS